MKRYIPQEINSVSGVTAADITDTTSTQIIAAQGTDTRCYISTITISNSHSSQGTVVKILDGSTVKLRIYARYEGGAVITLPDPARGSLNTAWNAQCETTGAAVQVFLSGFKQKEG